MTAQTPYMVMSVQANEIPILHNIWAAFFSWITLAGYLVLPGTFTSLSSSESLRNDSTGRIVQTAIQNIPLVPSAAICFIIGVTGSYLLWKKWKKNYIWLAAKIFVPGFLHALAGLLTTLINIYSAHEGHWSVPALVTAAVISTCLTANSTLVVLYARWLEKMKLPQDRELVRRSTG